MTNDEFPMTKEFLKPNDEGKACELAGTIGSFVLRPSFDIRHSDFVIFPEPPQRGLELDAWDFFGGWGLGLGDLHCDQRMSYDNGTRIWLAGECSFIHRLPE